jgi:hypothetical protein
MTILANIPIWVFPLFILLLVVGLRAMQRRHLPVALIYSIPLLGVLGLRAIIALPAGMWIWFVFAGFGAFGVRAGMALQKRWLIARDGNRVELEGEPLTLILMMSVFAGNFVVGMLSEVAPEVLTMALFQFGFAALLSTVSGVFCGRALWVFRASGA